MSPRTGSARAPYTESRMEEGPPGPERRYPLLAELRAMSG